MICDYCGKDMNKPFMEIINRNRKRNLCMNCVCEVVVKHFAAIDALGVREKLPQNSP